MPPLQAAQCQRPDQPAAVGPDLARAEEEGTGSGRTFASMGCVFSASFIIGITMAASEPTGGRALATGSSE